MIQFYNTLWLCTNFPKRPWLPSLVKAQAKFDPPKKKLHNWTDATVHYILWLYCLPKVYLVLLTLCSFFSFHLGTYLSFSWPKLLGAFVIPYQIETLTHIQLVIRDKQATKDGRNNSQNSKKTRLKSISVPLAAQSMTSYRFLTILHLPDHCLPTSRWFFFMNSSTEGHPDRAFFENPNLLGRKM